MDSVQTIVNRSLSRANAGSILSPADFRGKCSQASIKMALSPAVREGKVKRLAHGIYFVPMIDPLLGELIPSAEGVSAQLAEKEKVRIRPTGAFALHKLGLTTQVPTKLVYLTDGHPRKFTIGKATVEFKATTPKKMALQGEISGPLILALEELKLYKLDPETEKKVITLLHHEEPDTLDYNLRLATGKVYDYLTRLTQQLNRIF
jgi:hypothetical protein